MIKFSFRKLIFRHHIVWFSKSLQSHAAFFLSDYRQCALNKPVLGFVRQPFYTIHIDITKEDSEIISEFGKDTQYEIRRATRDGITFHVDNDLQKFIDFYNEFATSKNRENIRMVNLNYYKSNILFTMARHEGNPIVMHSYLIDNEDRGRVRLLHSASHFRSLLSSQERALVGRANRFLHYKDMLYFRNKGFSTYDFGGISIDDNDEEQKKIGAFKRGFGGLIVEESNFMSLGLVWLLAARKKLNQLLR